MAHVTERDGTRPNPALFGSLAYLLLNLPVGIGSFVFVLTTITVGVSTAIIWVGVPVLAFSILGTRVGARFERARVHAMLGTYIASPYRPLPEGMSQRWRTRVRDGATWRDLAYFLLLLPIGIGEFVLMTTLWSSSLWLLFLPIFWGFLPEDWAPEVWGHVMTVHNTWQALPWAAAGALLFAATIAITKALGSVHARYARAMLGPSQRRLAALERELPGRIDWSTPSTMDFSVYPSVTP
jgi:hypothetical protein